MPSSRSAPRTRRKGSTCSPRRSLLSGPSSDPILGPTFSFRHALLRDAAYASLARAERARLHVRIARWLEGAAGDHVAQIAEIIAGHLTSALDSAPALAASLDDELSRPEAHGLAATWFERGADAALAVAGHDAAASLLGRALEHVDDANTLERARLLDRLGHTIAWTSDMDEGLARCEEALSLYRAAFHEGTAAARDGYALSVGSVCGIYSRQLRFHEMVELAADALREIGEADDLATALVLRARLLGLQMIDESLLRPERATIERVARLAAEHGERAMEADARSMLADQLEPAAFLDEYVRLEQVVRELGRWDMVAEAIRMQGAAHLPDDPKAAFELADRCEEVAGAHGLTEALAWGDYLRAEAAFVSGDWDHATTSALRSADLGERYAYHRATVRTWHVLVPIAFARGDVDLLGRVQRWYDRNAAIFPDTPYARFSRSAVDVLLGRAGVADPSIPDLERLRSSMAEWSEIPSWFAGVEMLFDGWVWADDLARASAWFELFADIDAPQPSRFGLALRELLRARRNALLQTGEVVGPARRAAEMFASIPAPWWRLKSIRALDDAGAATPAERAEAEELQGRLGLMRRLR